MWSTLNQMTGNTSLPILIFQMRLVNRPMQAGDFVPMAIAMLCFFVWITWRIQLRPLVWLLEDRNSFTRDILLKWKENPAYLGMAKMVTIAIWA